MLAWVGGSGLALVGVVLAAVSGAEWLTEVSAVGVLIAGVSLMLTGKLVPGGVVDRLVAESGRKDSMIGELTGRLADSEGRHAAELAAVHQRVEDRVLPAIAEATKAMERVAWAGWRPPEQPPGG